MTAQATISGKIVNASVPFTSQSGTAFPGLDLGGWNHAGVYIDSYMVMHLSLNKVEVTSKTLGSGAIDNLRSQTTMCQLGGGTFQGSLRHFLIATRLSNSFGDYLTRYAN